MLRKVITALTALAAVLPGAAAAQDAGEVVLFSKGHFEGARKSVDGPAQKMQVFTVRSVQIPAGQEWELCSGNTFSGCKRFNASQPSMAMTVRSIRPAGPAAIAAATAAAVAAGVPVAGVLPQSLRGAASEFFVAPSESGGRIEIPAAGGNAAGRADSFCRSRGWRSAAHEDLQNVAGRTYLTDVLCVSKD